MKSWTKALLAGAFALAASVAAVDAAGFLTNGLPPAGGTQYPSTVPLTGNETFPADTNLTNGQNPASESISSNQLATFMGSQSGKTNALIGGDATTNLWQRATTGSSVTTTTTYGGPDRWFYWSGTNTAMTVSRDSTAANLPASGYQYDFKMARTAAQTGVVQVCMAQEVESENSYQFAGNTAELDFHATAGANFSATNSQMTAYIIYGTGQDEGAQKMSFGLNAGGGGASAWTGQANATAAVITISATNGRYAAFANIPATATEVGVALCFTPVGTAGANDFIAFSGIQLTRNNAAASLANATTGYSCANVQCSSFDRRQQEVETGLQQRYYYQLTETTGPSVIANCRAHSITVAECFIQAPVTMRVNPTATYATGFATETTAAGGTLGACTGLATMTTVAVVGAPSGLVVACTAATVPAAGVAGFLYNNGGTGAIKLSAEL